MRITVSCLPFNLFQSHHNLPMAPSLTPFCPSCPDITTGGGTPHTDIQAQFPTAPYCPHCNQFFSNAPINNARSNNPIDLTADSPNPRRRVKPSQQALTVPTSRPPPENYQMAIFQAQYNREESIQQDHCQAGQKSPSTTESIVIHIQAVFWIADGQLDDSFDGIQTYVFNQTPRIAQRSQGQIKVPLKSKFPSHEAMMQAIIERLLTCSTQSGKKGWTAVSNVGERGSSMVPSFFPLAAYETTSIGHFLFHSGITPRITPSTAKEGCRVTLHFWKFIEREFVETKRKRRADYLLSDIESEVSQSPSPKKNHNPPKRPRGKAIKAETIKVEPSIVKSKPRADVKAEGSPSRQGVTELDPFIDHDADVFDDAALNAELIVVGLSPEPLLQEEGSPVRRQSSRSTKGKARPRD
jgi:hypothetical protein